MVTMSKYLAFLSILFVCNLQLGTVLAKELPLTLTIVKQNSQYLANFNIGDCQFSPILFTTNSDGGISQTSSAFAICDNINYKLPMEIIIVPSPGIYQPYYMSTVYPIAQKCTISGEITGGFSYNCGFITGVIPTTTTTTTTSTTTTTTTTTTSSTTSSSSSTAPAPTSTCVMKTSIYGRKNGRGILKDCCKTSDDCYGSCKKGICDAEHNPKTTSTKTASSTTKTSIATPTPTGPCANKSNVTGQKKGNGILGDCCRNSDDCTGSCIKGKCDALGNPSGEKCISSNYYGKKNGKGPVGVCCKSEADCKNSCVQGKCIK